MYQKSTKHKLVLGQIKNFGSCLLFAFTNPVGIGDSPKFKRNKLNSVNSK